MTFLKPAVAYERFSDKKQVGNHSIELQDEVIMRAAELRGYEIVARFTDEGVSAYHRRTSQRHGMVAMVNYVLNNDCDAVFFYDESRISRQVTDFVTEVWTEIGLRKPDVKFISASLSEDQEWDPNDLQTQLRLVMASEESAIKSRRALDAQRMMLNPEHPKRPGSKAPFGFDMVDGALVQNDKAAIVYFIFHLASWGYSDEAIADVLNNALVPSPSGKEWNASSVDLVLNHKAHIGHLEWNVRKSVTNSARKPNYQVSLFEHLHEPIIPPYLFEMVHGLRRLKKGTGLKFRTKNFLEGIAICKSCTVFLKAKDQSPAGARGRYVKYICPKCSKKVSASELHHVVLERISNDWAGQWLGWERRAKLHLKEWQELLDNESKKLIQSKERANFGLHSSALSNELEQSFRIALRYIESRLEEINLLKARVTTLQTDPEFNASINRFGKGVLERLSDVERRAFLIATLEAVRVAFGGQTRVVIEYRLSPYAALENEVGDLTESGRQGLNEKPKAR